ncbi:MAG TPA: hypothetical protein VK886_11930 [Vicinamibacterales bacterium]|nr:hypothetical protein [Vicinamibacterales bacterium]
MIWFLEKNSELMACEVRRGSDGAYEYEVTTPAGDTRVQRYDHPTRFLEGYLDEQRELRRQGWRPRLLTVL